MNNRIKELMEVAEQYALDNANNQSEEEFEYAFEDDMFEKFAELIALECSSLCYNSNLKDSDAHAMNILNHFNIDGARHWK